MVGACKSGGREVFPVVVVGAVEGLAVLHSELGALAAEITSGTPLQVCLS